MKDLVSAIGQLEASGRQLETDTNQRSQWLEQTNTYLEEFIQSDPDRKAYNANDKDLELLDQLDISRKMELGDLLRIIDKSIHGPGINTISNRHLGYVPGGGLYASGIGDLIAAVGNRYNGLSYGSPGAVKIENKLIAWAAALMGLPKSTIGNLTSGGSIANLIALTVARDEYLRKGHELNKAVIYYTEHTHHCIRKALHIIGMGHCTVRTVTVDEHFRMLPESLAANIESDREAGLTPFAIIATLGSTNVGAIDPIGPVADIAGKYNLWLHLDAAYGGFFLLLDRFRHLLDGVSKVDSAVLDPHKSLFIPYGTGMVLVRDGHKLVRSFHHSATYLQDFTASLDDVSPADVSPELTRHFRGLRMWLPLQLHGIEPFKAALEEKILLTRYFYEEVQKIGFETGPFPDLSICIYRYVPENGGDANDFNERLLRAVLKEGRFFISSTTIGGTYWLRLAALSYNTHLDTIREYLKDLRELTGRGIRGSL